MSTSRIVPIPLLAAVALCTVLGVLMAAGTVALAVGGWLAATTNDDGEPGRGWLVAAIATGAALAACTALGLGWAARGLLRGEPRADGRASLVALPVIVAGLAYGGEVEPWVGFSVAAGGVAIAVLVNLPPVGRFLARAILHG